MTLYVGNTVGMFPTTLCSEMVTMRVTEGVSECCEPLRRAHVGTFTD